MKDLLVFSSQKLEKRGFASSMEVKKYTKLHPKHMLIGFSPDMTSERGALQKILLNKFYNHDRVLRMTNIGKRIITDLFNVYKKDTKIIPKDIIPRNQNFNSIKKERFICNCIASMTDRYAINEHKKLFDPYEKV